MIAAKPLWELDGPSPQDAPTVPPPERVSVTRYKSSAPVDELLYRVSVGDTAGLLDAAQGLFDRGCIPVLMLPPQAVVPFIGYQAELLLFLVDGKTPLEEVLAASGLEMLDALHALSELLAEGAVSLC
jgi:hypothetical protein